MSDLQTLTPGFIIYINGTRLGVDQESSVKKIVINDRLDGPAGFTVYLSDMNQEWAGFADFGEGNQFSIHLGYKDNIEEVILGDVVSVCGELKKNTTAMTIIKGRNSLHRLKTGLKTKVFSETTITDIISQVASDAGLSVDVDEVGGETLFWVQRNQSDYDMIMSLASQYNCSVWGDGETLYFKQQTESTEDVVLEWGKTLLEFSCVNDVQQLVTEVEVIGWDSQTGTSVLGTASLDDITQLVGGEELGGHIVEDNFGPRKVVLNDHSAIDQDTADSLAMEYLTRNSFNYVRAHGKCEGDYRIKAGIEIEIVGVGDKFAGTYLVEEVNHILQSQTGYRTSFTLRRNKV
ncbi:phage late control D family protein [Spirochaeta cellobiosiphila]|uniref:phage late control D family protein n=1 Tax=Spirochaeta cellobiosiphila TaxID=504483 RepID=UPI00040AA468|nr:phage late control D family protein [Spirochaeta cellobiosiphila]